MADIKVVSNRTIVKKVIVGTPLATTKKIAIQTTISSVLDVDTSAALSGSVLVYDDFTGNWKAQNLLNLQTIDGGDGF